MNKHEIIKRIRQKIDACQSIRLQPMQLRMSQELLQKVAKEENIKLPDKYYNDIIVGETELTIYGIHIIIDPLYKNPYVLP